MNKIELSQNRGMAKRDYHLLSQQYATQITQIRHGLWNVFGFTKYFTYYEHKNQGKQIFMKIYVNYTHTKKFNIFKA